MSFIVRIAGATSLMALSSLPSSVAFATTAPASIYDATGGVENGGDSFSSAGPILVDRFKTSSATTISSVVLNLSKTTAKVGTFDVVLTRVGQGYRPILRSPIATVSDASLTSSFELVTVKLPSAVSLLANTGYYIGIRNHPHATSSVVLGNTVDPKVLNRPSVVGGAYYYNNGGAQANAGGPYEVKVNVTP